MYDLNYQLKGLCNSHREGSRSTQNSRSRSLNLIANQLHDLGFLHLSANGLKPKHIESLLKFWKSQLLSSSTLKNRLAHLRWWADKIGKHGIIPLSNSSLDVSPRVFVSNASKATDYPSFLIALDFISDPHIKLSLQLQAAFGLRREESIKFQPSWADKGISIVLKSSWCKGGRQRQIPITSSHQRLLLDQVHSLVGSNSLIPSHRSYFQHLKVYESQTLRAGLSHLHGLRHRYAQSRYFQLTGWLSPSDGGPSKDSILKSDSLSHEQKLAWIKADLDARLIVSSELGHHRINVTSIYLGR